MDEDIKEALIKREKPHSLEAEQSVIVSMIMDAAAISVAADILKADDFYKKEYGILFQVLVDIYDEGKTVDLVTLQDRLKTQQLPPEIISMEFLTSLTDRLPTSALIKNYVDIVKNKSVLRNIIKVTEEIADDCYLGKGNPDAILEKTEKNLFKLIQSKGIKDIEPIKDVVIAAINEIEVAAKNAGNITGISTGFTDLDYKTAGLQPSDLILIAARPSMGKTAFALNIAAYAAFKRHITTVIFSLEMSRVQLMKRFLAMESGVSAQGIRTGNLAEADWEKLAYVAPIIGDSELLIDDTSSITVSEMRSKCRKLKLEKNLGLIIIDYIQLMTGDGRNESRQHEVSEISRSLKGLARELNVPVIALSQLNRTAEQRTDHRPMLSDLRESGAIEQDADVVMFLYRDEYYNKGNSEKPGVAEVIIAKQRNGPVGTVELAWIGDRQKFANLEKN